jgi:hypothetical protein
MPKEKSQRDKKRPPRRPDERATDTELSDEALESVAGGDLRTGFVDGGCIPDPLGGDKIPF